MNILVINFNSSVANNKKENDILILNLVINKKKSDGQTSSDYYLFNTKSGLPIALSISNTK
jgi:hypothetical protein